eukprot:JP439104.1.p2 GENE.JP439104.1~~JP439104.1.p2  ORF type:complete len:82 (-),score=14.05 JP439104.1:69-314(-)
MISFNTSDTSAAPRACPLFAPLCSGAPCRYCSLYHDKSIDEAAMSQQPAPQQVNMDEVPKCPLFCPVSAGAPCRSCQTYHD